MSDDELESLLTPWLPRGAAPQLRSQVLAAVDAELRTAPGRYWRRAALGVAASLLLALGLNFALNYRCQRRVAELFGPAPLSKRAAELAQAIERVTDAPTGRWAYERLTARASSPVSAAEHFAAIERLLQEIQLLSKDVRHATFQKDFPMDRDHPGRGDDDTSDCQRLVRGDFRFTA